MKKKTQYGLTTHNKRFDTYQKCHDFLVHIKGDVLFDLLISNGLSSNRFIGISFKTDKFDYSTIHEVSK
ncbi:MAG TPA: type II toxin-antitoxin system RnlB family antitoxin, partial [Cytophagaceae bacterium]|nr:type II toxin-antitoxin system RnlB family antitoxin [Cytophagaceae bacterium]